MLKDFSKYIEVAAKLLEEQNITDKAGLDNSFGAEPMKVYFTDPAIERKKGDIWIKDDNFRDILIQTSAYSDTIIKLNKLGHLINRVFIFDRNKPATVEIKENISLVLLIHLGLGLNVGLVRNDLLDLKYCGENNRNFYLISRLSLGFLDLDFPYIRMYRYPNYGRLLRSNAKITEITKNCEGDVLMSKEAFSVKEIDDYSDFMCKLVHEPFLTSFWQDSPDAGTPEHNRVMQGAELFRTKEHNINLASAFKGTPEEVKKFLDVLRGDFTEYLKILEDIVSAWFLGTI